MKKVSRDVNEVSLQTEADAFSLRLPTIIDEQPWQEVDLPRNKKAMIYEVMTPPIDRNGVALTPVKRYDAYVVSKKNLSAAEASIDYQYGRSVQHFENIPALKHWLYNVAKILSIKKQTRKVVNVQDIHEVDDE